MDAQTALALVGVGAAGGLVTAVAGGASLITFPAVLAAGLPPVIANASNTVALAPGNLIASLADRERMPPWDGRLLGLAAVAVLGSIAGAGLLLATPARAFTALVPALIGGATILFAFSERIKRWIDSRGRVTGTASSPRVGPQLVAFLPVAVYGGYFGAGMSVMLLAILSAGFFRDLRTANVVKNLIAGLTSAVAAAVFIAQEAVAWTPVLAMMAGALAGGFAGGRLVRILPAPWVRAVIITAGAILTAVYARRYWSA